MKVGDITSRKALLSIEHKGFSDISGWRSIIRTCTSETLEVDSYNISIKVLNDDKFCIVLLNEEAEYDDYVEAFLIRELKYSLKRAEEKQKREKSLSTITFYGLFVNIAFFTVILLNFLYQLFKDFNIIEIP
jgi:hypothetical protein